MSKLKTYSEFVNEALIDAVKNPIKWKKIKNNAKKYQKARVAQALNDVDYAKRKEKGSDTLSKKQQEVLDQANKAKNSALADTASNIGQRMADLATTDGLKQVVKLAKTKSSLAANKIVLKAADGEEAKRLKIKQTKLTGKATAAQKALADYESDGNDKPAEDSAMPTTEKPAKTGKDGKAGKTPPPLPAEDKEKAKIAKDAVLDEIGNAKSAYDAVKDGDDETAKLQAEINFKLAQQKKAKLEGNDEVFKGLADDITELKKKAPKDDPSAKLEADIKAFNDRIEDERTTMNNATKDLEQAQRDLKTGRGSEEKVQKLQKSIEDSKEDIAELKKKEADAKKKLAALPESFEYVAESVSEKFARLRPNL